MCSWWFIWNVKIKLPLYHKGMLKHTEACQGTGNTEICLLVPCEPCKIGGMNLNSRLREIMLSNRKTQATSWSWYPPKPANYFCLIIWGTLVEKSKGFGKKKKQDDFQFHLAKRTICICILLRFPEIEQNSMISENRHVIGNETLL